MAITIPRPFITDVDPAWVDYNGHVNDAAYALISSLANEELCVDLDLSAPYRTATGRTLYSAQMTIKYLSEIAPDATIQVLRTITRLGGKSMAITAVFRVGDVLAATTEHIWVMVDSRAGHSVPFNDEERARLEPLVGREF